MRARLSSIAFLALAAPAFGEGLPGRPTVDSTPPPALVAPAPDASPVEGSPALRGDPSQGPVLMGPGFLLAPAEPDMPFHIRLRLEPRNWV